MAVVTRTRASGKKTYYVKFLWNDREIWERAGHDRRYARSLNAQRLREVREGTYQPKATIAPTFREYLTATWAPARKNRGKDDEQKVLDLHVLSPDAAWFADTRMEILATSPHLLRKLVEQWRATPSRARTAKPGQTISQKSVANLYGLVRNVFAHARRMGVIHADPCEQIGRKEIPRKARSRRGRYPLDSIRVLLAHPQVHPTARVFAALAILTGAREGEVCGLRWSDWDLGSEPLTCLTVERQYDGRVLKSEKSDDPGAHARKVPVHPVLAEALRLWWMQGWELVCGRAPTLADPIVPRKGIAPTGCFSPSGRRTCCD